MLRFPIIKGEAMARVTRLFAQVLAALAAVVLTVLGFIYANILFNQRPFPNSDVFGIGLLTLIAILWVYWFEHRRSSRKADDGHH